ncbi:MAG: UDP-glucose/GDP-mannose dehydrogenase family protein [Proteobacteria bacterium]|nr:UDP-glucose/GDP-mannose dehydrogenase family protein [Pseudomonadota bacterium]
MKIAVIGTGYVGLVSGVCFAKIGHEVICVDNNQEKITKLENGEIPIYEPGLKEILVEAVKNNKISFTQNLANAVKQAEAVFIAVGTPQDEKDGSADLSFVYTVAKEIALAADSYKVVVTKSTVPVGTGDEVGAIIKKNNPQLEFSIVSNPEFLREGAAIDDFLNPDRVVVGVSDEKSKDLMSKIYQPLQDEGVEVIYTDVKTSELIKYAANSFLATKIAFINEMADLCEKVNGDIKKLSYGIGKDSRIGEKFLNPGPGFGGSCFPKDILALTYVAKKHGSKLSIVDAVIDSNNARKLNMAKRVIANCDGVKGKEIAVLGLAFKADTDDIRYSPALVVVEELLKAGAKVRVYDQEAMENTKKELNNSDITYCNNPYEAAQGVDALVIATEWKEFSNLDLNKLKQAQKTPLIIDLRNMVDPQKAKEAGFEYICIG